MKMYDEIYKPAIEFSDKNERCDFYQHNWDSQQN